MRISALSLSTSVKVSLECLDQTSKAFDMTNLTWYESKSFKFLLLKLKERDLKLNTLYATHEKGAKKEQYITTNNKDSSYFTTPRRL